MRNSVPFIGEQQITREDSEQNKQKRQAGKVIDEVMAASDAESSWDDVVPDTWKGNRSKALRPSESKKPFSSQQLAGKHLVPGNGRSPNKIPLYKTDSTLKTSNGLSAYVDWVPINSGHGLRINVVGNIDNNLRQQWQQLLEEINSTNANEFEFNLTATPCLTMTGLGMLLLFKERKASSHDAIKLCNCNRDVWRLLKWTGMDKYFVIQKSGDFS